MSQQMTVYTTTTCGPCRRLKRQLIEAGLTFHEVDIQESPEYGTRIEAVTGGYRTVPTVELRDRLLVNPSLGQIVEALGRVA